MVEAPAAVVVGPVPAVNPVVGLEAPPAGVGVVALAPALPPPGFPQAAVELAFCLWHLARFPVAPRSAVRQAMNSEMMCMTNLVYVQ